MEKGYVATSEEAISRLGMEAVLYAQYANLYASMTLKQRKQRI